LVHGDLVLAEPAARRIAERLAERAGVAASEVETYRHPASLTVLLQDLRTFSLFAAGKLVLAVDTAALADRDVAAELIDEAAEALPLAQHGQPLAGRDRRAALRLLQALRMFDLDPYAGPAEQTVGALPAWAFAGAGQRKRKDKQAAELRQGLAVLLSAARADEIYGAADGEAGDLAQAVAQGLPAGHALVLAERWAAADHPVVRSLSERDAVLAVGRVESGRGGWQGLDELAAELERQTGAGIAPDALAELARRTLRQEGEGRGRTGVGAESTARLAGEYHKLANLASGGRIDRRLVEQSVEDRGEEDVWQVLDAVGAGRARDALDRLHRLIEGASDQTAERLMFFGLLAAFCRQLVAVRGMMQVARVRGGEASYPRFKERIAPALQGDAPDLDKNPLAGLHPYRLHRVYLAASRLSDAFVARLPAEVLETEMQLKGEAQDPDVALARFVVALTLGR
jgi:hypothetical protein